eukprot:Protomagalhaensia_wolfi_Nauph_80__3108@NODE_317_length_2800_cov_20_693227_g239_i0_p1_GENE_NODE_317_length_2800_cov_20_693227_g239_i0NODE_317_length_2800_cov_20_693227_g239_i0_p1_ORF_typecomplete_len569_score104_46PGM_PMM_I/PF02878_16/1_9e10PGM_PMM_I/PF02878_16/1_3e10PGM_PMM_III/PF02880_16/9_3e11PGM_PMM_IV/PF00408_20/2e08PGM_PMM_II/PF02879_16/0_0019DUF2520/PF10728_9/0_27DUF2520/PF10728_9/1e04DUF4357/PF14267_6/0_34_NODE_317_length_2800_cov_20_693227_g239_i02061912
MEQLKTAFQQSPQCPTVPVQYGTAGFRTKATLLPHAMFRCGVMAGLRSLSHDGQAVGICITASHNPAEDNGVKLVEPDGGMLKMEWEKYATDLVNCGDSGYLEILEKLSVEVFHKTLDELLQRSKTKPRVVVARDTRESSPSLAAQACHGVRAVGGLLIDCQEATTPMLHWAVTYVNDHLSAPVASFSSALLHKAYYSHFTSQLQKVMDATKLSILQDHQVTAYCDAACGIGGICIPNLAPAFRILNTELKVFNAQPSETVALNDHCGAEHVQKQRELPRGAEELPPGAHCFAMDGDADRVVFFITPKGDQPFKLLDGDRLTALATAAFLKLWNSLVPLISKDAPPLTVGVIQTAYANGGASKFLQSLAQSVKTPLQMAVRIAKTGVKNIHKLAEQYDIGIWFESNGHGTICTKFKKVDQWAQEANVVNTEEWKAVRAFLGAFNWCVGDAMIDALCFELCLRLLNLNLEQAFDYYPDLHVVQAKKPMTRAKLDLLHAHPDHELWLVSPTELQDKINELLKQAGHNARAFLRASGTEDVCRVYAEADSVEATQNLANSLMKLLDEFNST